MLSNQEKLNKINSMEVVDQDTGGGELVYVHVADTFNNRLIIHDVVDNDDSEFLHYMHDYGQPDEFSEKDGIIDITLLGFMYGGADFWEGKFISYTKDELMDKYQELADEFSQTKYELEQLKRHNRLVTSLFKKEISKLEDLAEGNLREF